MSGNTALRLTGRRKSGIWWMSAILTATKSYLSWTTWIPMPFPPCIRHFQPRKPAGLPKKLEIHYTPKHGSWLDIAEIELNVMTRQCLSRRIDDIGLLRQELAAWESDRNEHTACIHWHFTTDKARTKLTSLYHKFDTTNEKQFN